jgi:ribosome-associated translation inhibitor RaiA
LPAVNACGRDRATMKPCSHPAALDERDTLSYPISINFLHMDRSQALEDLLREHAEKLGRAHPAINACHVVITADGRHKHQGRQYAVKLDIHLTGKQIAINQQADEDPFVAARDAFSAARRALDSDIEVKRHH